MAQIPGGRRGLHFSPKLAHQRNFWGRLRISVKRGTISANFTVLVQLGATIGNLIKLAQLLHLCNSEIHIVWFLVTQFEMCDAWLLFYSYARYITDVNVVPCLAVVSTSMSLWWILGCHGEGLGSNRISCLIFFLHFTQQRLWTPLAASVNCDTKYSLCCDLITTFTVKISRGHCQSDIDCILEPALTYRFAAVAESLPQCENVMGQSKIDYTCFQEVWILWKI